MNPFTRKRPNPKRAEPRRVSGRVRLKGEDMTELRRQAFERSGGKCEVAVTAPNPESIPLERRPYTTFCVDRCNARITWETMELMHRQHGPRKSDTLADVLAGCKECHRKEHNAGGKPVPRKPGRRMNQTEALAYWKSTACFCGGEKRPEISFCPECLSKLSPQLHYDVLNTAGEDYLKAMALAETELLNWRKDT